MSGPIRPGVRLALDWGQARIGVAACDPDATVAYPVTTVPGGDDAIAAVVALVQQLQPLEVVFGLPRRLAGDEGPAARALREVAGRLARELADLQVPVRLVDERLSTVQASRAMRAAGRSARAQRAHIDQAAAVAILEHALDTERATATPPGELLSARAAKARTRKRDRPAPRDDRRGRTL